MEAPVPRRAPWKTGRTGPALAAAALIVERGVDAVEALTTGAPMGSIG